MSDKIVYHFRYLVKSYYIVMNGLINKKKSEFYLPIKSFFFSFFGAETWEHIKFFYSRDIFCFLPLCLLGTKLRIHSAGILSYHLHPLTRPYTVTL